MTDAIGAVNAACVHERTLCSKGMELLTIDLAETSRGDLRKSEKNDFEIRRSAKRRVDLSRKPGFWIDHTRKHRFTVRHPACDLYPLTSDPGCRTALPTGKETHNGPARRWPRSWCATNGTLGRRDPDGGRGNRRLRAQPHFVSACLHVARDGRGPLQELRPGRSRHDRRIGPASGHLRAVVIRAVDAGFDDVDAEHRGRARARARSTHASSPRRSRDSASLRSTKPAPPRTTRRPRRHRPSRWAPADRRFKARRPCSRRHRRGETTPITLWRPPSASSRPRSASQPERAAQALSG